MRVLGATLLALSSLLVSLPSPVAAEFGAYGADGWPIAVDGTSTNPFPGVSADALTEALRDGDPLNRVGDATVFPYWPILTAEVQRLARDHPDLVRLSSVGKSTLGLDLWMLEICDFKVGGDGCLDAHGERRETVWIDGGHHSNEYSGVYFTLAWAQFLVEGYGTNETATWIVENRHTWVLPMVNPDGSNAFGRLNANLVNINRNYPVVWDGEGNDAVMNNRGPAPASEVETQISIAQLNQTRPDYYASIHCCGNLWLYPYGEEGVDPVDQGMLQAVCDEVFADVRSSCGPIWSTIYPASGSSIDTAYEYTGVVAFGYEMSGRGAVSLWGQPVTFEDVRTQEIESWNAMLHASLNVERYGAYPHVIDARQAEEGIVLTVANHGLGDMAAGTVTVAAGQAVPLPTLAVGAQADVLVPGASLDGDVEVRVAYQKRLEPDSNWGVSVQSIGSRSAGGASAQESPAALLAALAAVVVAVAIARRKA